MLLDSLVETNPQVFELLAASLPILKVFVVKEHVGGPQLVRVRGPYRHLCHDEVFEDQRKSNVRGIVLSVLAHDKREVATGKVFYLEDVLLDVD